MVYMMMGIQGSGKSTYSKILSKELNIPIVSSDKLRQEYAGIKDNIIWPFLYSVAARYVREGKDFIFDATNVTKELRKMFKDGLAKFDVYPELTLVWVRCPKWVSKKRARKRNKDKNELYLPIKVIDMYYKKLEEPTIEEGFKEIQIIDSTHDFKRIK